MTSGTPGISGTVRWRDGAGTAGAAVTVTDLDGRQHGRTGTDPDGGYVVGLPTGGTYLVVVAVDGTPPQAALVGVSATPVRHDVTLAGGATLNGTLVDAAGRPVPRAALALIDPRGDVVATGGPDPQGRFRLVAPGAGPYTLTVTAPGHRPVARTVTPAPDGTPIGVTLPARSGLAGTARSADGTAVAGARITVADDAGHTVASTVSGPDGRYALDDLPDGEHALTAAGHPPVVSVVQVARGTTTPVEVRFPDPRGGVPARNGGPR
ncbi:carboxypeptidase regulatory-like domain-containing protein [Pseudonocardia nantongensis]|uniref:carboxypeptidase regulatory-like domain-containing protein n=1 Tax=Pseudonocardia nantongensis TaxID=1181885 RepID=UPI00397AF5C2